MLAKSMKTEKRSNSSQSNYKNKTIYPSNVDFMFVF